LTRSLTKISSIYRQGEPERPTPEEKEREIEAMRARAWRYSHVVVVDPIDIDDPWLRSVICNYADKKYGPRAGRTSK
jgi:hypothetical protein